MRFSGQRKTDTIHLLLIISIVILIALISQVAFFRLDLTAEKRYSLSNTSKEILKELDDLVFVRVYLDGDLNIPFKRFQKSIRETLDEFKVYAGSNLQFEFVNVFEDASGKEADRIIADLYDKGLRPSNIMDRDKEGGISEKIIIPGAMIIYRDIEIPVNLLKNNPVLSGEENINNSIQMLEYELINILHAITTKTTRKIAFIEGHGELNEFQVGDISRELATYFQVDRGQINGIPGILDDYEAIIIAKPVKPFSEQDKFIIDQYIMNGGRVLWFIDAVNVSLDSMINGTTIALINTLNIDDQLFRYGVRINPNLIQDMQCNAIPIQSNQGGTASNFVPVPWLYYPFLNPVQNHPVTRNLNLVSSQFANNIDTIGARTGIKKSVLLATSEFSRTVQVPVMISLNEVDRETRQEEFSSSYIPVAVLLEGRFQSVFKNRMINQYFHNEIPEIVESGKPTGMLVVADGDIIRNETRPAREGTMIVPLGYDRLTKQTFGNKNFIINAVQYLTGDEGLITLRSKEIKLRLLDKNKIQNSRRSWILLNCLLPVIIIILAGLIFSFIRKSRYSR